MTQQELNIIRDAKFGDSHNDKVNKDLQQLLRTKTNDFTDPSAVSEEKYDMTSHLEKMNKSVDDYVRKFGSVMRSEADVCRQIIKEINGEDTGEDSPVDSDWEMEILLAEAAAKAAEAAEAEAEAERKRKKK